MANLSTSRQGQCLPRSGSFWKDWFQNPIERCLRKASPERHEDALQLDFDDQCHTRFQPTWSVTRMRSWIKTQCDEEHSFESRLEQCMESFFPIYSISTNLLDSSLFAATDHFGIKGIRNYTQWIFDSGATSSCTNDLSAFTSMSDKVPFNKIRTASGFAKVLGIGTVNLDIVDVSSNTVLRVKLRDVLYIPEVPINLISTRSMWNHDNTSTTFTDHCELKFRNGTRVRFTGTGNHYYCLARSSNTYNRPGTRRNLLAESINYTTISADTVHARLGHPSSARAIKALSNSTGLPDTPHYRNRLSYGTVRILIPAAAA